MAALPFDRDPSARIRISRDKKWAKCRVNKGDLKENQLWLSAQHDKHSFFGQLDIDIFGFKKVNKNLNSLVLIVEKNDNIGLSHQNFINNLEDQNVDFLVPVENLGFLDKKTNAGGKVSY